jgi:hypothetical protein
MAAASIRQEAAGPTLRCIAFDHLDYSGKIQSLVPAGREEAVKLVGLRA